MTAFFRGGGGGFFCKRHEPVGFAGGFILEWLRDCQLFTEESHS
jgi:hypothetical protein